MAAESVGLPKVVVSRKTLLLHLGIHAVALGLVIAFVPWPFAARLSFPAKVALVFTLAQLLAFPSLKLIADAQGVPPPRLPRWSLMTGLTAAAIYMATLLFGPGV